MVLTRSTVLLGIVPLRNMTFTHDNPETHIILSKREMHVGCRQFSTLMKYIHAELVYY